MTYGLDPGMARAASGRAGADLELPVEGALPEGLDGCLLWAVPHPAFSDVGLSSGPQVFSGVRLAGGRAQWFRETLAPVCRHEPLRPLPALAPTLWPAGETTPDGPGAASFARPVRDAGSGRWHTVATYPGLDHAEHLTADGEGRVLRAEPFALEGAPLIHAVELTRRYVVVLDLPVTYSPAAALIGARLPYVWRPNRPARIGLLPRDADHPEPCWLRADPGYIFDTVNAHDDGDRVVLEAIWHPRAFADAPSTERPHLRRWILDPAAGAVTTARVEGAMDAATVDERVRGRRHRHVFGVAAGRSLVHHDRTTGESEAATFGEGRRVGRPVFVPGRPEGAGWLAVMTEHTAERRCELRILDAAAPASGHRAAIHLPPGTPLHARAMWQPSQLS